MRHSRESNGVEVQCRTREEFGATVFDNQVECKKWRAWQRVGANRLQIAH